MILTVLQQNVALMNSGNKSFFYDCGLKGYSNLTVDEKNFPGVIYDFDSNFVLNPIQSGAILETYEPYLLFLDKSEIDWTMKEHGDLAIMPMVAAARELISLLQNDDRVDSVDTVGKGEMLFNLFNVNSSGVALRLKIKLFLEATVCVANS